MLVWGNKIFRGNLQIYIISDIKKTISGYWGDDVTDSWARCQFVLWFSKFFVPLKIHDFLISYPILLNLKDDDDDDENNSN